MKKVIAIQGNKCTGKDESARYIKYILGTPSFMHFYWIAKILKFHPIKNNWHIIKYADCLKKMLSIMINIDVKRFEDRHFKEYFYFSFLTHELMDSRSIDIVNTIPDKQFVKELKKGNLNVATEYTLSIRQILQFFGTEIMRRYFGDELWIINTINTSFDNIIISDQRFKIENKIISSMCNNFIIHITRPGYSAGQHASESQLVELFEEKKYDVLLENDGSLKDLFYKCKNIIYNYYLS